MQPVPLDISHIFHRAEQQFAAKHIYSAVAGVVQDVTVGAWAGRVRKLANALDDLDLPVGATVATFGHNSRAHLELYFAIPCTGRVLHTLNIRLSAEQLQYMMTQAEDEAVFVDRALFFQLWPLADSLPVVRRWIVMPDGTESALPSDPRIVDYEDLIDRSASFTGTFAIDDENRAAAICFTSGTTGKPKGVVYSHRSTVLHAMMSMAADLIGISERDTVMPIVPMFHASAWGLPYSALFAGANMVLPGPNLQPEALLRLVQELRVTVASAVPTVWASLLPYVDDFDLRSLRAVFGGGSATPPRLAEEWAGRVGVPITHTWGMTELSPTGAIGGLRSTHLEESVSRKREVEAAQGQAVPLVDLRIVDLESGHVLERDGLAVGELQAHGPTVAGAYLGGEDSGTSFSLDGWLRTGDLASIDDHGYVIIRDRIKDLIKSGGEWIPSLQLETAILSDPAIAEVAVVSRSDPRWTERPVAFVVVRPGVHLEAENVLERLRPLVPKWWLPDEVLFIDSLPRTGTGKIAKGTLKERL